MSCIVCGLEDEDTEYYCTKGDITVCLCERHIGDHDSYDSVALKESVFVH